MRYFLILVLAGSPLAALTGWSLWQAAAGAPPPTAQAGHLDTAAIAKLATAAAAQAKECQPLAKSLTEIELLETSGHELPDAADAKLKDAWKLSLQARQLVARYAKVTPNLAAESPAARRREAEAALARLREFIKTEGPSYQGQLEGAEEFFTLLNRRVTHLEAEIDGYRRKDRMAEAVAGAHNDLDQGRFDACLRRLDGDPLAAASDPDLVDELQSLRKRAEYRRDWERIDQTTGGNDDTGLFNAIVVFLRRYPDPPTDRERDLQTQIEHRRDRLKSEIAVHVLDQAADLDTLLVEAAQIIANNHIEAAVKQQARRQVTEWLLNRGLPKIETPASLLGKQEAVTKSGQRKIGIFFLPPGAEQYRFWTDRGHRNERPRGDEQFPRGALEQPPATPQYVAWAEQYNHRLPMLVQQSAARADWQAFADQCEEWQRQLTAYREQWGVEDEPDRSCREWTFGDAAGTARNVLRHWTQYEQIVGGK
jgi:hypothetical protein